MKNELRKSAAKDTLPEWAQSAGPAQELFLVTSHCLTPKSSCRPGRHLPPLPHSHLSSATPTCTSTTCLPSKPLSPTFYHTDILTVIYLFIWTDLEKAEVRFSPQYGYRFFELTYELKVYFENVCNFIRWENIVFMIKFCLFSQKISQERINRIKG